MIFLPFPSVFHKNEFKHVTLSVMCFCLSVFMFHFHKSQKMNSELNFKKESVFYKWQIRSYKIYLEEESKTQFQKKLQEHLHQVKDGTLYNLSFKDEDFMSSVLRYAKKGDPIQFGIWNKGFQKYLEYEKNSVAHRWGLKSSSGGVQYLSYALIHSTWIHLIFNLFFFFLFSSLIEQKLGSLMCFASLLVGALTAAFFYQFISGLSHIPLVGLSGVVCTQSLLVALVLGREKIRHFYWLLPSQDYQGFVSLPVLYFVFLWVISDLSGLLSTPTGWGGVAYAAHLGGFIGGFFLWIFYLLLSKSLYKETI